MERSKFYRTLITGIVIGIVLSLATTAFAASVIIKAEYNSNKVIVNGKEIPLKNPMVSIVDEATPQFFANYMPVRDVLEEMDYEVSWDEAKKAVIINSRVTGMEEPLPLRDILTMLEKEGIKNEVIFDGDKREVNLTKGSLSATIFLPPDGVTTAKITCGEKETEINLIIKDRTSFINEKEIVDALRKVGFVE